MRVFLDTNVFLLILNKEDNFQLVEKLLLDIHRGKYEGFTSVICVSEILSGFYLRNQTEKADRFLTALKAIGNFTIADVDLDVAEEAAKLRAKYKMKLPDAIIASSSKLYRCRLITQYESIKKVRDIEVSSVDEI